MGFYHFLALRFPSLKKKLIMAGINKKPIDYVKESVNNSLFVSILFSIIVTLLMTKSGKSFLVIIPLFMIFFFIFFMLFMKRIDAIIIKRAKEIDKDVLFAGRFLLVKLNSGKPLINSLIDASNSYGVAEKYFKEIVNDINLGTPIEEALDKASNNTPSKRFRKILFQINNALKIGVDVSTSLENTLDNISQEQLVEIQRYGKKLNSLTMFYMLIAIVLPSLGVTLISVIGSMISLNLTMQSFIVILFILILVQLIFISMFKSIRPNVNI